MRTHRGDRPRQKIDLDTEAINTDGARKGTGTDNKGGLTQRLQRPTSVGDGQGQYKRLAGEATRTEGGGGEHKGGQPRTIQEA